METTKIKEREILFFKNVNWKNKMRIKEYLFFILLTLTADMCREIRTDRRAKVIYQHEHSHA